jgi:hypothetical protein
MRADTFTGQLVRALARHTPAFGADNAASDIPFGRSVLLALRRRSRAFVEQPPGDADAILDSLEADLTSGEATVGHERPEKAGPGVLYHSGRVTVTSQVLFVDGRQYAIADLRRLHLRAARQPAPSGMVRALWAGSGLLALALVLGPLLPVVATISLTLAGLSALTAAAVIRQRTPKYCFELRAQHRRAETLLFVTPDRQEQAAVAGAIVRAMRMIDDTSLV